MNAAISNSISESAELTSQLQKRFADSQKQLPGAHETWVRVMRRSAMDQVVRQGMPTTRHEAWKYTDVKRYLDRLIADSSAGGVADVSAEALAGFGFEGLDCHRMVIVDGKVSQSLSQLESVPAGVRVESMARMLIEEPDTIEPHLHDQHLSGSFAALNSAMMADGVYLDVPDGIVVEKPLHLLFLSTTGGSSSQYIRNLIVAGEYSQVTVIEHHGSVGESSAFINTGTDVEIHAGGRVEHYKLQQSGEGEVNIGSVRTHQHRDSYYHSHSVAFGAALSRRDIHVEMNGEGAECALNGLYLVGGRQHVDHHTRIDHLRPNCRSRESYKGVIDGRARAVFNGKVVVHEGADKTDSAQSNANLLLSDKAEVDTKPDLEIHADDVKCAHGATVGQLDMHQLFYLRSRGLSEAEARNVLMFAFTDEVLTAIRVPQVRKFLEKIALAKLPHGAGLEELLG
ncbi:MAG: Fe-S cluster assembly protein SufD [Mariprofundaceae bacterium]|nr:Fe-S cluster assembly protein SufD [Mariprofundaceae bacterium]